MTCFKDGPLVSISYSLLIKIHNVYLSRILLGLRKLFIKSQILTREISYWIWLGVSTGHLLTGAERDPIQFWEKPEAAHLRELTFKSWSFLPSFFFRKKERTFKISTRKCTLNHEHFQAALVVALQKFVLQQKFGAHF